MVRSALCSVVLLCGCETSYPSSFEVSFTPTDGGVSVRVRLQDFRVSDDEVLAFRQLTAISTPTLAAQALDAPEVRLAQNFSFVNGDGGLELIVSGVINEAQFADCLRGKTPLCQALLSGDAYEGPSQQTDAGVFLTRALKNQSWRTFPSGSATFERFVATPGSAATLEWMRVIDGVFEDWNKGWRQLPAPPSTSNPVLTTLMETFLRRKRLMLLKQASLDEVLCQDVEGLETTAGLRCDLRLPDTGPPETKHFFQHRPSASQRRRFAAAFDRARRAPDEAPAAFRAACAGVKGEVARVCALLNAPTR